MLRYRILEAETAEPTISQAQMHFLAKTPLRADAKTVANDQHPDHQLGIDRWSASGGIGRSDAAIAAAQRAVVRDPLDSLSQWTLSVVLFGARHYQQALAAADAALTLDPDDPKNYGIRGIDYYALGNLEGTRVSCEIKPDDWGNQVCLTVTYDKLGRHADADAMLDKLKASLGDDAAYQYAEIYKPTPCLIRCVRRRVSGRSSGR
jgi:tetratricopeptide (TPR) repeat protein